MTDPDTPENNPPKLPRGRMLFFALLLVVVVIGMYVSTYYKIITEGA